MRLVQDYFSADADGSPVRVIRARDREAHALHRECGRVPISLPRVHGRGCVGVDVRERADVNARGCASCRHASARAYECARGHARVYVRARVRRA